MELYIDRGHNCDEENADIYDLLFQHKTEIEQRFGGTLDWQRMEGKRGCRIQKVLSSGGYRSEETHWPQAIEATVDAMIALEKAITPHLPAVRASLMT